MSMDNWGPHPRSPADVGGTSRLTSDMLIPDLLLHGVGFQSDAPCVTEGNRSLSFAEVDSRADRLANALRGSGVMPGDRVALLAYNELEHLEIQVGVQRAGAVLVPLNVRLGRGELEAIVADCEPILLIHGPGVDDRAVGLQVPAIWHLGGDGIGRHYDAVLADTRAGDNPRFFESGAVNSILYTSGTTGRAKGVVISNGAFWARITLTALETRLESDDTLLFSLPLFHAASSIAYASVYRGGSLVLMRTFGVAQALAELRERRATHAVFVPTMIRRLVDHLHEAPGRFDDLRLIIYGGSPIAPDLIVEALERFDCGLLQVYGLSEAVNLCVLGPDLHDPDRRPDLLTSAGRPSASYAVRVVGPDNCELPPLEIGEIVVQGPAVMCGYWQAEEATAATLRDGWLCTGDAGYRSNDGFVFVSDRIKDIIVSGGENVYSREVEEALLTFEGVHEVAVFGVPSREWGEAVHAVVVLRDGVHATASDLIAHCRDRISSYKAPKSVEIVPALPKNASGKILKRDLREEYWSGRARLVG